MRRSRSARGDWHRARVARPRDLVLIAGKGHEDYQILGAEKIHFDDREVAREEAARDQRVSGEGWGGRIAEILAATGGKMIQGSGKNAFR